MMKSNRLFKFWDSIKKILVYLVFVIVCLLPLYWLIKSSFTERVQIFKIPPDFIPIEPVFRNFIRLFDYLPVFNLLKNSLIIALGASLLSVFFCFLAAYVFARMRFRGSNILLISFIITMAFPQMLALIPLFEILKTFNLVNTFQGLIIIITSEIIPFTVWIMVTFIRQIPFEIEEAAIVDGASRFTIITRIIFPLTLPAIASMVILNFISGWNELLYPLIFSTDKTTKTLSVALGEVMYSASTFGRPWDIITSLTTIMIIPTILIVIFLQRYIISGLTQGSVK